MTATPQNDPNSQSRPATFAHLPDNWDQMSEDELTAWAESVMDTHLGPAPEYGSGDKPDDHTDAPGFHQPLSSASPPAPPIHKPL